MALIGEQFEDTIAKGKRNSELNELNDPNDPNDPMTFSIQGYMFIYCPPLPQMTP